MIVEPRMTLTERRRAAAVLRARMDELNISAAELARRAHVDPTTVRAILRAERDPSTATRERLAGALDWPVGAGMKLTLGATGLEDAETSQLLAELAVRLDNC